MRVNINIPDELLSKIDDKAKSLYVNRTAWIVTALAQKLQSDEALENLPEMLSALKMAAKIPDRASDA